MATTNNPIDSSSSLATLAAVQRRLEQLSAFQARQSSPQATATLAEEALQLDEEPSLNPDQLHGRLTGYPQNLEEARAYAPTLESIAFKEGNLSRDVRGARLPAIWRCLVLLSESYSVPAVSK
jgi:hypothetical protein